MKTKVDRRELLALSAAGAAALVLPKGLAYAEETKTPENELQDTDANTRNALEAAVSCMFTGDSAVDENNRNAYDLWSKAVAQAYSENSEIITMLNPLLSTSDPNITTRAQKNAYTNTKRFTSGLLISIEFYLGATYDVDINNKVSGFRNHGAWLTYGLHNATITVQSYSTAIIDGGRTYAVYTNLHTQSTVAGVISGAGFQTYSEYYYTGGASLY